jgi:hypothetical protein
MKKVSKEELTKQIIEAVKLDDLKGAKFLVSMLECLENDFMEIPF